MEIKELWGQKYHANREGQVSFLTNGSFVPSTHVTAILQCLLCCK